MLLCWSPFNLAEVNLLACEDVKSKNTLQTMKQRFGNGSGESCNKSRYLMQYLRKEFDKPRARTWIEPGLGARLSRSIVHILSKNTGCTYFLYVGYFRGLHIQYRKQKKVLYHSLPLLSEFAILRQKQQLCKTGQVHLSCGCLPTSRSM